MNIPVEIEEAIRKAEMKHWAIATTFKTLMLEDDQTELEQEGNKKKGLNVVNE
jgi:hypothetical protein